MTAAQLRMVAALSGVSMLSGIPAKRFVRDMATRLPEYALSEKQDDYLRALVWRYRRQIKDKALTAAAGITSLSDYGRRGRIVEPR